jgi:hypothetical protein
VEAHRVVRRRGSHIFWTIGSQMTVRLSALCTSHPLPPGRFLVLISVRGWVDPMAIVQLEVLGKLKKIQWPHRELNLQPSRFYQSASTNYAATFPSPIYTNLNIDNTYPDCGGVPPGPVTLPEWWEYHKYYDAPTNIPHVSSPALITLHFIQC